jgi:hypothetical protein
LHPDEKPQDIITQYIEGTIEDMDKPPELRDKDTIILNALSAIIDRLEKIEQRPLGSPIPFNPVATKEQANESLICAKTHQFICSREENKPLCSICKQQDFWKNAKNLRIALEMEDIEKPGEIVPEDTFETKAINCKERTTNAGLPFCVYKYRGDNHHNYCSLCWELIEIWGEQAAGYAERKAIKEV